MDDLSGMEQRLWARDLMRITAKAEYACLAIIELAKPGTNGSTRRVREIAESQGIPERYLIQLLLQIKAAGLAQSTRGPDGGYLLICPADQISVADVISVIEGSDDPPRKNISHASDELADVLLRAWAAERKVLEAANMRS